MTQPAEQILQQIRRFEIPDIDRHGMWLLQRIQRAYPHLDQRSVIGWLRGLIYNRENMFLFQEHSVGLAVLDRGETLNPKPLVRERFVFAQSDEHIDEAALFYPEFARWGRNMGCERMIINEKTDVPLEKIKKILPEARTFAQQITFATLLKE
jgi:hypothetical protein